MEHVMTKLPEKKLLVGNKLPRTTTGEMKEAFGQIRDFLAELLGEDSSQKETARQALGIDLSTKADRETVEAALTAKADKAELDNRLRRLEEKIIERETPIGSVHYFAIATPPAGYLKADGSSVGRETYPELFTAIGTTFGEGDGETTFHLPNLMGRFAEGSATPGTVKAAGLPNITGYFNIASDKLVSFVPPFTEGSKSTRYGGTNNLGTGDNGLWFDASTCHPVYGASDTVQPPALTLLPCIKACHI